MTGRWEGFTDEEWEVVKEELEAPPVGKKGGRPWIDDRLVWNSAMYVLITGCRWVDIPVGEQWAKKSTAHRRLRRYEELGQLEKIQARLLGIAHRRGLIDWENGAIDGSFSPWQGRRRGCGEGPQG